MVQVLVVLACVALSVVSAAPFYGYPQYQYGAGYKYGYYGAGYGHPFNYYGHRQFPFGRVSAYDRWIYYGPYTGTCEGAYDGLYYVDEYNFAYCHFNQKTIQPCAEGSANPPLNHYTSGAYYGFYDFCSVNLVNLGYNNNQGHQVHTAPAVVVEKEKHNYDGGDISSYEHGENKELYGEEKVHVVEEKFLEGARGNRVGGYEEEYGEPKYSK